MKCFDAIVIGAGQAGPSLAGRLTAGMTVAVIERKPLDAWASPTLRRAAAGGAHPPTVSDLIPTMLGEIGLAGC